MEKIKAKIEKLKDEFSKKKGGAAKDFGLKNITLRSYQEDGVKWLIERNSLNIGCILADDMGLGKTAQTIGLLVNVLKRDAKQKILVLTPLSVADNWRQEIDRFTEGLEYLLYIGAKEERQMMHEIIAKKKFQILLSTYELAMKDEELLSKIDWSVLIVDEGHRLKNSNTQLFKCLSEFNIDQRVLLTGTPIQNNLEELYSLLCFIQPNLFKLRYIDEFCSKYNTSNEKLINELTSLLQPFVLRRVKSQVNINLPTRYECILYHSLTKLQKQLYKAILTKNLDVFNDSKNKKTRLVSVMMNLRKIALHPYLMPNIEPEPFETGDHLFTTSGKYALLDKLLEHLYKNKHKVLLFSQFTCVLDVLQDYLTYKEYNYERIDGSIRGEERNIAVKNFNSKKDVFIFLLSTKAGGVGLNLVSADTCIFMDNDFNPHNDLQAAARIHRIGQQRPTMIIRLICKSTIEEIIYKRAMCKLKLSNDIIESGQLANNSDLIGDYADNELTEILKFGLSDLFLDSGDDAAPDVNFDKLLAPSSREGVWLIDEKLKEKQKEAAAMEVDEGSGEDEDVPKTIYEFEGKDYTKELFKKEDDEQLKELLKANAAKVVKENDSDEASGGKRKRPPVVVEDEESQRKRTEQEKLAKKQKLEEKQKKKIEALKQQWADNSYESLKIEYDDVDEKLNDVIENEADENVTDIDTKFLNFVKGDVTELAFAKKKNAIMIHCVDTSGQWGRGGLFDALIKRASDVPALYKQAFEMHDLNLGDVHFIKINNKDYSDKYEGGLNDYLALVVAQKRDKNGHLGELSLKIIESAFKLIFLKAKELKNTAVHMPRIGHNTPNFNWYAVERLIKKYLSNLKIPTYIYYFKRRGDNSNKHQTAAAIVDDDEELSEIQKKTADVELAIENDDSEDEELPNIFKKYNFFFYNLDTEAESLIEFGQLKRYIVAYNGNVGLKLDDEITHVIVNDTSEENLKKLKDATTATNATVVKYNWLELCLLKKKLINIEKFTIDL